MNVKFVYAILIIFGLVLPGGCEKTLQELPPMLYGTVRITAQRNSNMVDSMEVFLDGQTQGMQANPCLLTDLESGKHQFSVVKKDPANPIDFTNSPQLVFIKENDTADVAFELTKIAPNFTLKNLANEDIILANYRGKVVLMVFYSHT